MFILTAQILVLRDTMAFYSEGITKALKKNFQGYAYVMDWERTPQGVQAEDFWKGFWKKVGDRYDMVIAIGPKSLSFALKNIKDRPVIFIGNYQRLLETPPNFSAVYVSISYPLLLSRFSCSFEESKILGVLIHRNEWDILSNMFEWKNPRFDEVHIFSVDKPTQVWERINDLRDVGVKVVWIPPGSILSSGDYLQNLLKASSKKKVGVLLDRVSTVRSGALAAWEPKPEDIGEALVDLILDIKEISKPYIRVVEDSVSGEVVKRKIVEWKAFLKPRYLRFIKSKTKGHSAVNLSLAKKLRLKVEKSCIDLFDDKY